SNSSAPSAEYSPLVQHWNGTQWSIINGFQQGTSDRINAMVAISSQDITVVGDYRTGIDAMGPYSTLVEHWNGTQWSSVSSPSPGSTVNNLLAVARAPANGSIWAVGFLQDSARSTLAEVSC